MGGAMRRRRMLQGLDWLRVAGRLAVAP